MGYLRKRIFTHLFDFEHILTPIAIEHISGGINGARTYRIVYIFGIRDMFYSTTKFQ